MTAGGSEARQWAVTAVPQLRPGGPSGKGLQEKRSRCGAEDPSADRAKGDSEVLQLQPAGTFCIQMPF